MTRSDIVSLGYPEELLDKAEAVVRSLSAGLFSEQVIKHFLRNIKQFPDEYAKAIYNIYVRNLAHAWLDYRRDEKAEAQL